MADSMRYRNRLIYSGRNKNRQESDSYLPVVVGLHFIEGFPIKSDQIISCQVGCTLFDLKRNQFLGRTCIEKTVNNVHNRKLNITKNFYFYTSNNKSLAVVFEVSVHQRKGEYFESVGWCCIEPLQHARKTDTSNRTPAPYHRISLMCGSPRSLLLESPFDRGQEDYFLAPKLQSVQLIYTAQSHMSLLKICHLFPEDVLVSGSEIIPGLVPVKKVSISGVADYLQKPKIKKCTTCVLDNVIVKILPSVTDFEEELLTKIREDRAKLEGVSSDHEMSIVERRLNIGVHNGWTYIQEKEVQHLIMDSFRLSHLDLKTASKVNKIEGGKTKRDNGGHSFVLRSRVKLLDVPEDSGIYVVFVLQYIISVMQQSRDRKPSLPTINQWPTLTVALSWGKWFPFAGIGQSEISINLTSDPIGNPDENLLFRTENTEMIISFIASVKGKETKSSEQFIDVEEPAQKEDAALPAEDNAIECTTQPWASPTPKIPVHESTSQYNSHLQEMELSEVALSDGSQLPILPTVRKQLLSCRQASWAMCLFLQSVGFPVISDQHGMVPQMLEEMYDSNIDFEKEVTDPLQCNDIVVQFLALSRHSSSKSCSHNVVYFSFEFYRFPPVKTERLLLEHEDYNDFTKPYILHSLEYDGTKRHCPPGYEHLCRQSNEAVQTVLELEIWQADYAEEYADKEVARNFDQLQGILYVKVSNIGSPLSVASLKKLEGFSMKNMPPVLKSPVLGGEQHHYYCVKKARPLVELNCSLASFLTSHCSSPYTDYMNGMSEEKRRKLFRMEAVRKMENNCSNHCDVGDLEILRERMKDLETIDAYRENHKPDDISSLLTESVTIETTIHPCKGTAYFFEFELFNPYSRGCKVFIEYQHTNLQIVKDVKEWQHLRELWNIEGQVEHQFFSKILQMHSHVLLCAHERIRIPFKYLVFHHEDSITEEWQATTGHAFSTEILTKYPISCYYKPLMTKVYFKTQESKLLYILNLHIQPLPPAVDQIFHFLASENAFFKRWIRIPKAAMVSVTENVSDIIVLCSDSNVVSGVQKSGNSRKDPVDVYIKVACGEAGTKCQFFLFIFGKYLSKPIQTWLINVTAIHRIDLALTVGHSCQSSLILRGFQATQLVQCYSSHPKELQLFPSDYFTLPANTIQELKLILQSVVPGTRKMYINMVDMEYHTLLKTWLVFVSCQKPTVSKAFQLHLPLAHEHGATKRITYANPYNYPKIFLIHNSHPHLLQLAENELTIDPSESTSIGLYFPPQSKPLFEDIYIFINNTEGKNEETFSIRLTVS